MLKYIGLALALSSAFATAARAQQTPPPAKPQASAEAVTKAKARADEIIAEANAADLFENVTAAAAANVRHRKSGMECSFDVGDASARITIYPNGPRGDDVSCGGKFLGILTSTYATRFPATATQREVFLLSLQAVRVLHPDVKDYKGQTVQISAPALERAPKADTAYFTFTDKDGSVLGKPGAKLVSRLAVASYDGWMFKQRMSAAEDQAMTLSLFGEAGMLALIGDVTEKAGDKRDPSAPPTAAPLPKPEGSPPNP